MPRRVSVPVAISTNVGLAVVFGEVGLSEGAGNGAAVGLPGVTVGFSEGFGEGAPVGFEEGCAVGLGEPANRNGGAVAMLSQEWWRSSHAAL